MSNEHEIEIKIKELEASIALRNHLYKLLENDSFKALILDGYIRDEAVRTTKLLGDPSVRANERVFNSAIDELKAIGLLDSHFIAVQNLGNRAEYELGHYLAGEADDDEIED